MEFYDIIILIYLFILGSIFASFFGVVISRVPKELSIVKPSSHCENCNHILKWYENIPIFSYIFLKGKCSKCKTPIGIFGFVFEIIGGLSLSLSYLAYGLRIETIFIVLIVLILLLIAGFDYQTNTILDIMWIIFLFLSILLFGYRVFILEHDFIPYLIGATVGFIFFMGIKVIGKLIMGVDCLGGGDVIIMAIAGLILNWGGLLVSILIASILGSIIELTLIKLKVRDRESEIAFCPYLCLGIFVALLYGQQIIDFYMGLVI